MEQLAERVEGLVVEAAKARGTAFAFRDPLWVTWPLSRFGTFPFPRPSLPLAHPSSLFSRWTPRSHITLHACSHTYPDAPRNPHDLPTPPLRRRRGQDCITRSGATEGGGDTGGDELASGAASDSWERWGRTRGVGGDDGS
jgi:hypothetical protein